jgi:hypothetical protein
MNIPQKYQKDIKNNVKIEKYYIVVCRLVVRCLGSAG